jgi:hypothetical protein
MGADLEPRVGASPTEEPEPFPFVNQISGCSGRNPSSDRAEI